MKRKIATLTTGRKLVSGTAVWDWLQGRNVALAATARKAGFTLVEEYRRSSSFS
jgi:hypothetical protein